MSIVSGVTPKGTIWIKNFNEQGRLVSKRVIKDGFQFDTGFRLFNGEPSFLLKTDMFSGKQLYKAVPSRTSLFVKLNYRSLMKSPMSELKNAAKYVGQDYADFVLMGSAENCVSRKSLLYKCQWSPLEGKNLKHQVNLTVLNGKIVYKDGKVGDVKAAMPLTFCR